MTRRERAKERVADARAVASERMADAAATASERVADAKTTASERVADARTAASDRVADAKTAADEFIARQKPRLRGVSHEWAFFVSLVAGAALVVAAPNARATAAVAIYAASLSALLGVSALYHRINWRRPEIRRWMRRLDHSMIFLLIAGTVTPFAVLVLDGALANALLIAVWAGAAAGIVVELVWIEAPKWATALVYVAVGWIGALGFPGIVGNAGLGAGAPDRGRRRPLHRGRGDLRAPAAGPEPRRLRLPRDLPPLGDRRRRGTLRRRGDLRPAGRLRRPRFAGK